MKCFSLLFGCVLVLMVSLVEASESSTDILIEKLTGVYLNLSDEDPTKVKVSLRLGDLYSEKARQRADEELKKGCIECTNGEGERKKAIDYYNSVVTELKFTKKRDVLLQISHLYELIGENASAETYYLRSLAEDKDFHQAHFSLAELYFKTKQFEKAKYRYKKSLSIPKFKRVSFAKYRISWCYYNLGDAEKAVDELEKILEKPKHLLRESGESFKAEVAKDYTVFVAHLSKVDENRINKVFNLSPEISQFENLSFVANELERLGQTDQAINSWNIFVKKTSDPIKRAEGLIRLSKIKWIQKSKEEALVSFEKAVKILGEPGFCNNKNSCESLRKKARLSILEWNRMGQKKPSSELIRAYSIFLKIGNEDPETLKLAIQTAMQAKKYKEAQVWNLKLYKMQEDESKKESILIRHTELSELGGGEDLGEAQEFYLKNSVLKTKEHEVLYQIAQKKYDQKKFIVAAKAFKEVAELKGGNKNLKVQSGNMALASLVSAKRDNLIENWSGVFAKLFPKENKRFLTTLNKSILSQLAKASKKSQNKEELWSKLQKYDTTLEDYDLNKKYLKNKIILARELKKYKELKEAIKTYLKQKVLSQADRKFALENRIWLSELELDFRQAYKDYAYVNPEDHLELAKLADLAGVSSSDHYLAYLKANPNAKNADIVCLQFIKKTNDISSLKKYCSTKARANANEFSLFLVKKMEDFKDYRKTHSLLKAFKLLDQPVANIYTRHKYFLKTEASYLNSLKSHNLEADKLSKSILKRVSLIERFEKNISKAIKNLDWLSQVFLLTSLNKEYLRFYNDILALPLPTELNQKEKVEYQNILAKQIEPFKEKSGKLDEKLSELWKSSDSISITVAVYPAIDQRTKTIFMSQLQSLKEISKADRFKKISFPKGEKKNEVPSLARVEKIKKKVISNPEDIKNLKKFMILQSNLGNYELTQYLENRISKIKKEGAL